MKTRTKIWIAVLVVLIGMQAFRPARNSGTVDGANFIGRHEAVPPAVQTVLMKACYDCHSNHTDYPWYTNIQPVGWWMQHHVNEGKEELNFSEWATFKMKRKIHKLEEVREEVEEGHMPISSYTWVHGNAKLSPEEQRLLIDWSRALEQKLRAAPDSAAVGLLVQ